MSAFPALHPRLHLFSLLPISRFRAHNHPITIGPFPPPAHLLHRSINLPAVKLPVSLAQRSGGIDDIVSALTRTLSAIHIRRTTPTTTEVDVGDDRVVLEVLADVAVGRGEIGQRGAPGRWVRSASPDVVRDRGSREEPGSDAFVAPFEGVEL